MAFVSSYTLKEQTESSDIDILGEFSQSPGIRFIDLANELEQIIGFKVDLASKKGIKKNYLQSILSDLIYV